MRTAALAFALGVCLLQFQPALPGAVFLACAAAFAATALATAARCRRVPALGLVAMAFATLGFAWAAALAHLRLADRLAPALEGEDVAVTGVVAGLPQRAERSLRFDFDVEAPPGVPSSLSLAWYDGAKEGEAPALRAGERWKLTLRLRRPRGNANPHGFDYEAWLLERGTRATGYVRAEPAPERLDAWVPRPRYAIERLREAARDRILGALPGAPYAGVLAALAIGDQRAIPAQQWRLFAQTGVSHLMSISGLHVTMVAGLFAGLVSFLWRRSERLALALPAQKAAAAAGFLAAFAYCLLSGFAVPAQRTLYMVGVVALALWTGRTGSASRVLALALFAVLVLDPWAVLSPGFWLSFAAVAVIFYVGGGRTGVPHWLANWGRVQWAVTVGLAPLLLVLFRQVSVVSPAANAVAIPLVSFVVTPLALAGAALPFNWPLALANWLLEALMALLVWLAALPGAVWHQHAPAAWTLAPALAGIAWMLLPRGWPARWLGAPLMLPMFLVLPPSPRPGELWVTVFDVGQGLAVLARTERHALLYDAGPRYGTEADAGGRVVLPYLRGEGVRSLDALVVSHDDGDHSGGAQSVLDALPVATLWSSLPADHPLLAAAATHVPCTAGRRWEWDGVEFEFLHPAPGAGSARVNDRSCVLRIAGPNGSALLAGDIERAAEAGMLERDAARLPADLLLVPHHGSRTSSTPEFVKAVAPRWAVFTVGYRNRFGHPREDVVERYREAGSSLLRTDETGALELRFAAEGIAVAATRETERRYWHGR